MRESGVSVDQIQSQLSLFGESIPAAANVALDNKNYSIVTTVKGDNVEDVKNIVFLPTPTQVAAAQGTRQIIPGQGTQVAQAPKLAKLSDFATFTTKYSFIGDQTNIGLKNEDKKTVLPAVVLTIKAAKGSDLSAYTKKITDKFNSYEDAKYLIGKEADHIEDDKVLIIENFSVNDQNKEQVNEVISGLIGGKIKGVNGPAANIGWLLGGIQLVFLVMLAFVSWRAAIIAAIAIPLSLVFSNIYLYFIGESLNTLVLFSLVLVIGLVVDPALVILESIQRKLDTGLKGNDAVLAAVKDVGNGLFLATLTNIIVFVPFGVISGIIGQIFSYIPLTIIPAIIGSYIVPLVFLAWLGGLVLKPSKNKTEDEEKNLWGVAKWLIALNERLLNGSRLLRVFIILLGIIIPFALAGLLFNLGKIKTVQFSSNDNGDTIIISGSFLPEVTKNSREEVRSDVINIINQQNEVKEVFPFPSQSGGNGLTYFIQLKPTSQREIKSNKIAETINREINNKYGIDSTNPKFFDIKADIQQTGPPQTDYQVSIAIKTDNLNTLQSASLAVGQTLKNTCLTSDKKVVIDEKCDNGQKIVTKVDDGYTNKQNKTIEVLIDREKLAQSQLVVPNAPLSILVNQQLKQLFGINDNKSVITLTDNGDSVDVILDKNFEDPKTLESIKNVTIFNTTGQAIKLGDIAQINEKTPKNTIQRVKGQTISVVQARLAGGHTDQGTAALVSSSLVNYYKEGDRAKDIGLNKENIEAYSEGNTAANAKSFTDLLIALLLAIVVSYIVLAVFFQSFTQPLVILYTIPLTFLGMFPALAYLGAGQIGFLEIIGIIILIGIVENVAIFLIDAAKQKIAEGWDEKRAISFASGVRLRAVMMTKFTAIASLAPLAFLSVFYRSIALVIMFGLLTSGFLSLVTTPILFVFFRWLSKQFAALKWYSKILFFPFFPIYIIVMALRDRKPKTMVNN